MSGLDVAYEIAAIAGGVGTVIGGPAGLIWLVRRLGRANKADTKDAIEAAVKPISDRVTKIEVQFGPNGNGLRQAVDTGNKATIEVKAAVDGLVERFNDHLTQATDDRRRLGAVEQALFKRG